ncbi:hypothetical protein SAMN05444581_11643 [Methylocapsa palsarum]|uniref:Uncharacterized protein n=1 Tax=Methylocapsa palsarum TaxID=1612308 RepID=A0A1I4BRK5_9HYPH|nr:hypothetical protein SAMN05444581_11643 [Methylocapsa palsarum]
MFGAAGRVFGIGSLVRQAFRFEEAADLSTVRLRARPEAVSLTASPDREPCLGRLLALQGLFGAARGRSPQGFQT